jgi:hypothetical protein
MEMRLVLSNARHRSYRVNDDFGSSLCAYDEVVIAN